MERVSRFDAKMARGEKINVIIYTRVSTRKQDDEGSSLETQERDCGDYCNENGYNIIDVVSEVHSGFDLNGRKKFLDVLARCKNKEVDAIVFRKFDRLSRNDTHNAYIEFDAERHGYKLICTNEKFDENDPTAVITRTIVKAFANFERSKILERTSTGRKERARKGHLINGKRPRYGYAYENSINEKGKTVVNAHYKIDEEKAAIVRRIDTLYLEGRSQQKIAELFTKEGILTPAGNTVWNHTTIAIILNCTEYHGEGYSYKRHTIINEKGRKQWINKPIDDCIKMPESAYPIIRTKETYDKIQEHMRNGHSNAETCKVPKMLLKGFVRCKLCGRAMNAILETSHYNGKTYYYPAYKCQALPNGTHGPETKHHMQIVAKGVEEATVNYVKELLRDLSVFERALIDYINTHSAQGSVATYEHAIEQTKLRQAEIAEDLEGTRGNARQLLMAQLNKLEDDIEELEKCKREVSGGSNRWENIKNEVNEVIDWIRSGNVDFDSATLEKKQDLLRVLGLTVYIKKEEKEGRTRAKTGYDICISLPTLDSHVLAYDIQVDVM